MGLKQQRQRQKRSRRWGQKLLTAMLAAAPLAGVMAIAQAPQTSGTSSGIEMPIDAFWNRDIDRPTMNPSRPNRVGGSTQRRAATDWPHDIERVLGAYAGSLATATGAEDASILPRPDPPGRVRRQPGEPKPQTPSDDTTEFTAEPSSIPTQPIGHHHRVKDPQRSPLYSAQPMAIDVTIPAAISHGPYRGQLDRYRMRASQIPEASGDEPGNGQVEFAMWWHAPMVTPLGFSPQTMPVDIAGLTQTALVSSPYVQGILTEPQIRCNDLVIADADFDSLAFVEAKFADTNEPVGDALTTGDNSDRFVDHTFSSAAGLRKKTRHGGSLELVQRGGYQDNNSTFLIPNPQGTTRLEINFTQPLMKDRGRAVNNTRVLLAQIDLQLANSEVRSDLEDHLTDVTRAYWELYLARAEWLQRKRLLDGAAVLQEVLQARGEVDSLQRQILRAQVAVTSRRSDLVRAETRIRNAQARLRLLTGDPRLIPASRWELTPQDQPLASPVQISVREATITALDSRPDIAQSIRRIQAVSARVGAAKNQVLPRLDMILSTYVAGLDDKTDVFGAWANQFRDGRPSYAAGLQFEIPLGNRASRARLARNRWELTRALFEFQQTTEVAFTEVEVAVRETKTAYDEMVAKKQAIDAAQREVSYLQQRWELLPDRNESAVLLIENLLDAQERLADEERAFVQAQVAYAMSWVQLRKAMGVLLRLEDPGHSPEVIARATAIGAQSFGLSQPHVPLSDTSSVPGQPANGQPGLRGETTQR